jgi:hypothetical protein
MLSKRLPFAEELDCCGGDEASAEAETGEFTDTLCSEPSRELTAFLLAGRLNPESFCCCCDDPDKED